MGILEYTSNTGLIKIQWGLCIGYHGEKKNKVGKKWEKHRLLRLFGLMKRNALTAMPVS
jgi:hypothetical protein